MQPSHRTARSFPRVTTHLTGVIALLAASACVVPDNARPTATIALEAKSAYVHRGMIQNEKGVLQPSVVTTLPAKKDGTVVLRSWGNMDLSNDTGDAWLPDGHEFRFSQLDWDLLYEQVLGEWLLTMGIVSYNLPNGLEFPFGERGATTELLVEGTTRLPEYWDLKPSIALHYDYDEVDGAYIHGALAKDFELDEKSSVEVELGLGWSDDNQSEWNYAQAPPSSGFADLTLEGRYAYRIDDHTRVKAMLGYSTVVDGDYSKWIEDIGIDDTILWIGTGVEWSY